MAPRSKTIVNKDIAALQRQYPHLTRGDCIQYLALEGASKSSTLVTNSSGGGRLEKFCRVKRIGAYANLPEHINEQKREVKYDKGSIAFVCGMITNVINRINSQAQSATQESVDESIFQLSNSIRRFDMLPKSNAPASSPQRAGGMTWLKPEMLTKQPKEAKILMVRTSEGNFGTQVTLKLALDGHTVFDSLTVKKNPNYTILEAQFGNDENDWIGKRVLIGLEQDEFTDKFLKRYSLPPERQSKK